MCLTEQLSMSPAASPQSWFNTSLILAEISTGCTVIWFDSPVLDEERDRRRAMEIKNAAAPSRLISYFILMVFSAPEHFSKDFQSSWSCRNASGSLDGNVEDVQDCVSAVLVPLLQGRAWLSP